MAHQMPAFSLIDPEPVTENVAKSLLGIFRLEAFQVWIEHPVGPPLVVGREKPRAFCGADPDRAGSRPWWPASTSPRRVAARNRNTKTKSLKCPACRAAPCRLSVKPSRFRLLESTSCSGSWNQRNTNETSTMVADDRLPPISSPSNCRRAREHPASES